MSSWNKVPYKADDILLLEKPSISYLLHEGRSKKDGAPIGSGRYPLGSGENPYQRSDLGILTRVAALKKQNPGISQTDIAKALNMSTTEYRKQIALARESQKNLGRAEILRLTEVEGLSFSAACKRVGVADSTARDWFKAYEKNKETSISNIADQLKERISDTSYVDISAGSEAWLGITSNRLANAVKKLQKEGYEVHETYVKQMTADKSTTIKVLTPPNTDDITVHQNKDRIKMVTDVYFDDNGMTARGIRPPVSVDGKRVFIRYGDQGGSELDGTIFLRPGVEDLSLGKSRYAQVRIAVDDKYYLKGVAMYSDDIPKGYDIVFNTNKPVGTPTEKVFKPLSDDPDNPFGSSIKESTITKTGLLAGGQSEYIGADGKKHLSPINKIREEDEWERWTKTLSSQFLSKQTLDLAKKQLTISYTDKASELEDIRKVVNPTVRRELMNEFADNCDSAAVDLKAAALPRQASRVLLPVPGLKDSEVYAPGFRDGETVVLIRYPHGGRFEIPELRVNNRAPAATAIFGKDEKQHPRDAVGINPRVAQQLSGADFDGDTVTVIPNPKISSKSRLIKTEKMKEELANFDPKAAYPEYDGMKRVKDDDSWDKQREMGKVSNLITDMTIKGAKPEEIVRAVKHSMVVIDAEKHNLNWRGSEIENGIRELRVKYQKGPQGGASTLISAASGEVHIEGKRREGEKRYDPVKGKEVTVLVDPDTGKKLYTQVKNEWVDKEGKIRKSTTKSTQMAETDDPYTLSSGTPMENLYASYASSMKSMANATRKEALAIKDPHVDPEARVKYASEVASLDRKVQAAIKNKPLERQAQIMANAAYASKLRSNPTDDWEEKKKLRAQCLAGARNKTGALGKRDRVYITEREWEAIEANALPASKVKTILLNSDSDRVKELATPRQHQEMSPARVAKAKAMANGHYTQQEIADALGVSRSTVSKYLSA